MRDLSEVNGGAAKDSNFTVAAAPRLLAETVLNSGLREEEAR